jgi:hypothetical protein
MSAVLAIDGMLPDGIWTSSFARRLGLERSR